MRREAEVIRWLTRGYSCATATGECPPAQRLPGFGLVHDPIATAALRRRALGYFRSNLNVFRRPIAAHAAPTAGARSRFDRAIESSLFQLASASSSGRYPAASAAIAANRLTISPLPDYDHAEHRWACI